MPKVLWLQQKKLWQENRLQLVLLEKQVIGNYYSELLEKNKILFGKAFLYF